jgi:hypothetical protein
MGGVIESVSTKPMRLFAVTVLRAHNTTKGRKKAADRKIYVLGTNPIKVKDIVETGKTRVPGIKTVLDVVPVGIRDLGRLGNRGYEDIK